MTPKNPSNVAFLQAHARVTELIDRFARYAQEKYLQPSYQEVEARKDFIDPLFKALGWDVDHEHQHNPYEQEVKVESGVIVQSARAQKRADYAFYLAPNFRDVRFYVEAKKPSIQLEHSVDTHFQTLRYGYSAGTPLAVLTDFEQIRVLDCRRRPHPDSALQQVYKSWHYSDFRDTSKFAEFYWLFSREAHADGSYLRRVGELPKPKGGAKQRGLFKGGYQPVDESFLLELAEYRETLAKAFKKADVSLDSAELTELVQRTLDRLVFMRFLEDKQIETEVRVSKFGNDKNAWADFQSASRRLDTIYNGIVFKALSRLDDADFQVDDDAFGDICERLASENSPYNFDAIPIHILGSIYERFLGSVIRATEKRATVEEKPEVRKAGGVYYTPEYIVRYIVAQTVGKLIAGKTPDEISKMRFADIACGSGSFLLGIYDELLRYHADWYNQPGHEKQAKKAGCVKTDEGRWRLSLAQRRNILQNNIYGVDLDRQAVEVAQLSLFLKLLEDERAASAHQYRLEFARDANMKKLLPDLDRNIVCGNSLISLDIAGATGLSAEDELRLNPLEFRDAFPQVMRSGGFDAVVGNPPYGAELQPIERKFLSKRYALGTTDTAALMLAVVFELSKPDSLSGMILPKPITYSSSWATLRSNTQHALKTVVDVGKAWKEVKLEQSICIFGKEANAGSTYLTLRRDGEEFVDAVTIPKTEIRVFGFWLNGISDAELSIGRKIVATGVNLGDVAMNARGAMLQTSLVESGRGRRVFGGRHVARYNVLLPSSVLPTSIQTPENGQVTAGAVLAQNIIAHIANPAGHIKIIATLASQKDSRCVLLDTINQIRSTGELSNKFLLGIINSKLVSWYMYRFVYGRAIRTMHFDATSTNRLPIPRIDFSCSQDKFRHDRIVALVDQMLEAKKQEVNATGRAAELAKRKCAMLDRQIDDLVYELYGLTEEEIRLVENA
ncbi:MAG: N-6 DNA methylase [Proteobacteria bacterium]|nr:N-6 DNA methylase [Pseudomonadota bacterium]MCL2306696.1 N-6 DNA methylase [Pseudomonadota bacterium]